MTCACVRPLRARVRKSTRARQRLLRDWTEMFVSNPPHALFSTQGQLPLCAAVRRAGISICAELAVEVCE
eukprot:6208940-Pleurochrysis_carterae.AAC.1